jgi:hypothetical protein
MRSREALLVETDALVMTSTILSRVRLVASNGRQAQQADLEYRCQQALT